MSLLSPKTGLLLLSGRVLLRAGGRLWEQAGEAGWEGGLAILDEVLAQAAAKGPLKGGVSVGLSHNYARALTVAPPPVRLKADEMDGWVRGQLTQDFGAEAAFWRVAWQDVPPGHMVPVAVMESDRYEALAQRLAARGLRLASASPLLAGLWRRHHRALVGKTGWLALVEPGRVLVARVERGRLQNTRSAQADTGVVDTLAALLTREALQSTNEASGDLWLAAPDTQAAWQSLAPAFRVRELVPAQAGWGRLLA